MRLAASEGITMSFTEAEGLVSTFYNSFPEVKRFVDRCHAAVLSPGYVETAFGRRRYFYPTDDRRLLAEYRRQAQNTPVQGTVADALNVALYHLYTLRNEMQLKTRIVLPVHDATLFLVPKEEIEIVKTILIPTGMTASVPIPGTNLRMSTDIKPAKRWGETLTWEEALNA